MLELVWQKTETILAILAVVGIVAVAIGSIALALVWVCDVLKLGKNSTRVPMMHPRKPTPPPLPPHASGRVVTRQRKHKPGHRRSAHMDFEECPRHHNHSLDSTCPGGSDDS